MEEMGTDRSVSRRGLVKGAAAGAAVAATGGSLAVPAMAGSRHGNDQTRNKKAKNLRLAGYHDLQARSAYQPVIELNPIKRRWIAYVGHHGGRSLNPLTNEVEENGTSIIDVTNVRRPRYLSHIPGKEGAGFVTGCQMVRIVNGTDLSKGDPGKVYMLRSQNAASPEDTSHQIWDVTDPTAPALLTTVVSGLVDTHKSWWEPGTGIAYLVSGVAGWRTVRMTQVFDLSDPLNPVHIRDFGLVGQEPGATGPAPPNLHGPISVPEKNRIYFAYGINANGIMQIVDREKLLTGATEPTPENLAFPEVSQLRLSSLYGAHTTFPVLGMESPADSEFSVGHTRDIAVIVNETFENGCSGSSAHQQVWLADITEEETPQIISNYRVRESEGSFCDVGGRFSAHSSNENMTPIYYRKVVFISYFNAGVRAVDIRDPFSPTEIGFYIPEITDNTEPSCIEVDGEQQCKTAISTNNAEVDNRGYIYIVDRLNTGMHILRPTGQLAKIAKG